MKTVKMTELMTPEEFAKDSGAKNRGVYVWGFDFPGKPFIPYYVGKHYTDMSFRLGEHLDDLKNGIMKVLHKDHQTNPSKFASKSMDDCVYEHSFFKKTMGKYAPKSKLPKETQDKIAPHVDNMLKHIKVAYIPVTEDLEEEQDDKPFRWVNMLERWIQDRLAGHASHPGNKPSSDFKPKIDVPASLKHAFKF